ncbi:MAG: aminotransferase DegT [Gemmatales bacterium]|nr:MAG: aminotransferase DegT [Gemmatales bacterium]
MLGGQPVRPQGPPSWPLPDDDVLAGLQQAFQSGQWGQYHGEFVERLEQRLAQYHHVSHVMLCASGTIAVEMALRGLRVGAGDEVLLAAYDYPGNFLTVHALGARPVLVDVAPENWNLDAGRLERAFTSQVRALIVSHLHGGLVDMTAVMDWAGSRGVVVVEDAAQCPGATIQGRRAGTWGDVGILSFGGSKLLSAGRGGAILTQRTDVYQRIRAWMNRGNWIAPLSPLQAAVLLPQLERLDERNAQREKNAQRLRQLVSDIPGLKPFRNRTEGTPGYYKMGWQFDAAEFGMARATMTAALRAEGIAFDEGFKALHQGRSPSRFRAAGPLTEAEKAHHGAVILHHPILLGDDDDLAQVAEAVRKVQTHAAVIRERCEMP